MNRIKSIAVTTAIFCLLSVQNTKAQLSEALSELQNIYRSYDSMPYLTFDVEYIYDTDTLYGHHTHDQVKGSYTMNGKKALYKLGDISFMQNESFLIGIYERDKFMIVGDPQQKNAGSFLPMRGQIDSVFSSASQHYTIIVQKGADTLKNDTSMVILTRADSQAQFDRFMIVYDSEYLVSSVSYSYTGLPDNPAEFDDMDEKKKLLLNVPRKKTLTIHFNKYRFGNSDSELYETNSYIYLEDGEYKPVTKYTGYKVYNASSRN